jgi:hypothetical protein
MSMAYQETPEDRAMTTAFRWYKGQKIDIRWRGGWLTPEGEYYPVDYKNGVTHETIADEHGSAILGSGSITSRPPIMRIFDIALWMRITYLEYSTFCVELKGNFKSPPYKRHEVLVDFVLDYRRFENYFVNDTQYDSFSEFVAAIIDNRVQPKHTDPKLEGEASKMDPYRALRYKRRN